MPLKKLSIIVCLLLVASTRSMVTGREAATTNANGEQLLMKALMRHYEPSVRPVSNHSRTLNIHFKMKLTQILELSEKEQVLTTNIWIEQQWLDEFLRWKPENFSNIRTLRMPSGRLWLPDTFIYNNAGNQDGVQTTINGPYAMIRFDGLVKYPVPMKLRSNCEVDITYFPFDHQICYIKIASWIHDLAAINLSSFDPSLSKQCKEKEAEANKLLTRIDDNIDLSNYVDNSGWILLDVTFFRREKSFKTGVYPELVYFIHVKRRYLYYIFNVIIPCAMLSALTCMTFWLPCISGEKVTMGLTCFVAYSVFMLMVAEKVPATSETVPIISIYLTIVMSFTSVSVLMAVIVTNIHEKTKNCTESKKTRLPEFIRYLFLKKIARCLGMEKHGKQLLKHMIKLDLKERRKKEELKRKQSEPGDDKSVFQMLAEDFMQDYNDKLNTRLVRQSMSCMSINEKSDVIYLKTLSKNQPSIKLISPPTPEWSTDANNRVRNNAKQQQQQNPENSPQIKRKRKRVKYRFRKENLPIYFAYEYVLFGMILDRLFFWIYFIATIISYLITLYVFPFLVQSNVKELIENVP